MNISILALAAALTLHPDASLRIVNPSSIAVDATLCGRTLHLAPGEISDLASDQLCEAATLQSESPLIALELTADAQRVLAPNAACPPPAMIAPQFACPRGTTSALVPSIDGATYTWTIEGGAIISGDGTNHIAFTVADASKATLNVAIASPFCNTTATAVIAVREPLSIHELKTDDDPQADEPMLLTWAYAAGAAPKSQMLISDLFESPIVLPAGARSYTFTPDSGGTKSIELRASYAVSLAPPARKRRRAAGATLEPGVLCPAASSTLQLEIRGCATTRPRIVAPEEVEGGKPFSASIKTSEGEQVEWSVENGTLGSVSSDGSRANIRAGDSGEVLVSVRKEGVEACVTTASAKVPIYATAGQCSTTPPTAVVSLDGYDCDGATVHATFTRKPPFAGEWSDGSEFRVTTNSLTKRFTKPGTWSLASFHDSSCAGSASGSASVKAFRPTVKLVATQNSCGGAKLVATFTGVPPFNGKWSDGADFSTNTNSIERTVPEGRWYVTAVKDAVCNSANEYGYASSETFEILGKPKAYLSADKSCLTSAANGTTLFASFTEPAMPPFRVEWSDGPVSTSNESRSYAIGRPVPNSGQWEKTYTITRAIANGCEAELARPNTTLYYRPTPVIAFPDQNPCLGETVSAKVSNTLAPAAEYQWAVQGTTIVGGRFTSQVTFTSDADVYTKPTVEVTYPDGLCPSTAFTYVRFSPVLPAIQLRANTSTIKTGGVVSLTWNHVASGYGYELPSNRHDDFVAEGCGQGVCHAKFYDTVGPGTVVITMNSVDCAGPRYESVTITIQP
jgi:hypothetical protein